MSRSPRFARLRAELPGQKVISRMPLTMAEGMKIGQQWSRERGKAMIR